MYRSKVWRTRLDATTNWAVATTGIALSVAFSNGENSPLPLVLVALLDLVFLAIEARRYRYFDIWRTRVRLMEVSMYGPLLRLEGVRVDNGWNEALARDYERLHFHISFWEAAGRRLRRNYSFLFAVQAVSYVVKICIHPTPVRSLPICDHSALVFICTSNDWTFCNFTTLACSKRERLRPLRTPQNPNGFAG